MKGELSEEVGIKVNKGELKYVGTKFEYYKINCLFYKILVLSRLFFRTYLLSFFNFFQYFILFTYLEF